MRREFVVEKTLAELVVEMRTFKPRINFVEFSAGEIDASFARCARFSGVAGLELGEFSAAGIGDGDDALRLGHGAFGASGKLGYLPKRFNRRTRVCPGRMLREVSRGFGNLPGLFYQFVRIAPRAGLLINTHQLRQWISGERLLIEESASTHKSPSRTAYPSPPR